MESKKFSTMEVATILRVFRAIEYRAAIAKQIEKRHDEAREMYKILGKLEAELFPIGFDPAGEGYYDSPLADPKYFGDRKYAEVA